MCSTTCIYVIRRLKVNLVIRQSDKMQAPADLLPVKRSSVPIAAGQDALQNTKISCLWRKRTPVPWSSWLWFCHDTDLSYCGW